MSSCSSCERESNNKHFQCPPRMADGRAFTDYKPRCGVFESLIKAQPQPMNSYEMRQYMIQNGESILSQNRNYAETMNACGPCKEPWNIGTMLPEQSMVKCNASTCSASMNDPYGLGQGRDYGIMPDSDFQKRMTHRNEAMRANPANCCTAYEDDLKYYPIGNVSVEEERHAIPGGGAPF